MTDAWIGAGGWGYFRGPSGHPLEDYALAFRFVEVNATFYRHSTILDARRWRRSVPNDFRFSVKGHRAITHGERFQPTRRALAAVSRDAAIARALKADILVLETPHDLPFGPKEIAALKEFSVAAGDGLHIALEPRALEGRELPAALVSALRDVGGIDVVDPSKGNEPRVESPVEYARLFGKGDHNRWEFSDTELQQIEASARSHGSDRMVFAFHGVRMYKDAARFAEFHSTGTLRPATRQRGIPAVEEVLAPDARFPTTHDDLLRDHGWKVVTTEDGRNVHAAAYLSRLQGGSLGSLSEVIDGLSSSGASPP